jgi:hypothetical protein
MTWGPENHKKMKIGAALANCLDQKKSPVEVAKELGISTTRLRQIECLALYKIAQRLKQLTSHEEVVFLVKDTNPEHRIALNNSRVRLNVD